MRTILRLVAKEYRLFFGDRPAVSLTFIVPVVLIALWGTIFGNTDSGPRHLQLAFLNASPSSAAKSLEHVLDTTQTFQLVKGYKDESGREVPFDSNSIKEYVQKGNASAALVIPIDAFTDTSFGLKLKFYYDPKNDMEMQIIQGVLTQTVMAQVPDMFVKGMRQRATRYLGLDSGRAFNRGVGMLVSKYFKVDTGFIFSSLSDTSKSLFGSTKERQDFFKNILDFQSEQVVGKDIANPWATRSVGGWAMMFLMFTLTASSVSLFAEKYSGVVLRILASPVSRAHILWSKYLYNMSLGFVQLIVLFVVGSLLFRIDIVSNVWNLILIIIVAAIACTSFGMLLAAFSKTQRQANGLGTLLILAMSSIGGAWFPTSFMPGFIQLLSKATIVYWSMDGFLRVLWRQAPTIDILPDVGVLLGISTVVTSISLWQFNKGHVF